VNNKYDWINRIKAVEREYLVVRLATARLLEIARADPTVLGSSLDLRIRDVVDSSERLEGTYLIRLFAEFETGLRLFWPTAKRTDPPGRTRDLVDGMAATRSVDHDYVKNVHAVREYRNSLVHERDEEVKSVSLSQARKDVLLFF